jgi:integrase/recombinase XerC
MANSPLSLQKSDSALAVPELQRYIDGWFIACELRPCSAATLALRHTIVGNFLWFVRREEYASCDVMELRSFFLYIGRGHKDAGGRWGNPNQCRPVKPRTIKDYHGALRTLFRWIVAEGGLTKSPMERIPVPIDRPDTIQPFTQEQISALIAASKSSRHGHRDVALVLFLLDTGVRASELCALRFADVDISAKRATVDGKGGKSRPVYFGKATSRALWQYLREDGREPDETLFQSERGDGFTRSGLQQFLRRMGSLARISGARCSPHTFRHTFAINFLRNGGNQFSLMQILGHTNLQQTSKYVKLAQADCEKQHRAYSPADSMTGGRK